MMPPLPAPDVALYKKLVHSPLKLHRRDKVWIVSGEGKYPRDVRASHEVDEVLRVFVTQREKASLVESIEPPLVAVLDMYQTRSELPYNDMVLAARTVGATKILVCWATSFGAPSSSRAPFLPPTSDGQTIGCEVRLIDVATGNVTAVAEIAQTPPDTEALLEKEAAKYDPKRKGPGFSPPDTAPTPKPEPDKLGRAWRKLSRFSDAVGPQGIYDDSNYEKFMRGTEDIGSPFPVYTGDSTMLVITSTPSNARVYVNGSDMGLTPCWLPLEEGQKVVILKDGYFPEKFRVGVERRALHFDLRPQ
jgi:hypothetical protein